MSTYWGYFCRNCDERSEKGYNHGDRCLQEVYDLRHHLHALLHANTASFCISTDNGYGDALDFLDDHLYHDLCLEDEYRRTKELKPPVSPTPTASSTDPEKSP
jgi:hypothetical protein